MSRRPTSNNAKTKPSAKNETRIATGRFYSSTKCVKLTVLLGLGAWLAMILFGSLVLRELPKWSKLKRTKNCPAGGLRETNIGKRLHGNVCCGDKDNGPLFTAACYDAYDPFSKFLSGMAAWVIALVSPVCHHVFDNNADKYSP